MKKFLILLIAVLSLLTVPQARAVVNPCVDTLYETEFNCPGTEPVFSYCSTEQAVAIGDVASIWSVYYNSYCEITRDSDDELYEIIAEQMAVQDPLFNDPELIRFFLVGLSSKKTLEDYLDDVHGDPKAIDKLPLDVQIAFFGERDLTKQDIIFRQIKAAYDKEKIIHQSKASMKQQFKAREMWSNGTLSDSPFDLIVDLNLIEIVLFGSLATWMDDVYSFANSTIDNPFEDGGGEGEGEGEGESEGLPGPVSVTGEGGAGIPIDQFECIADEDLEETVGTILEAIIDDGPPGPGKIPPGCGNLSLDEGEECDDGNNVAGDGCSESCLDEPPASLSCPLPDAITFKLWEPSPETGGAPGSEDEGGSASGEGEEDGDDDGDDEIPIDCPEGSTPVQLPAGTVPQSPNYPGPFVGGVLKNFPQTNPPPCPAGTAEIEVTFSGFPAASTCIPAKLCAEFDAARAFLFGEDWNAIPSEVMKTALKIIDNSTITTDRIQVAIAADDSPEALKTFFIERGELNKDQDNLDEALQVIIDYDSNVDEMENDLSQSEVAAAIEVLICIEVIENKRGESPYETVEGCVDCHFMAMNDIMNKLLEKNIAPLENSKSAWGTSNRWGPSFSFDLDVGIQSIERLIFPEKKYKDIDSATMTNLYVGNLLQDTTHQLDTNADIAKATVVVNKSVDEIFRREIEANTIAKKGLFAGLKNYRNASEAEKVGQNEHLALNPMLKQLLESFKRLQSTYLEMALGADFADKKECTF